jgi:histidinol-phosphatase
MKPFDLDRVGGRRFLDALCDEVLAAGRQALALFAAGAASRARQKPDRSPVTEADEAVEVRLRGFLARERPDAAFLGEETGASPVTADGGAKMRFIVDPIDGTRAFLRGLDSWSILVGLEVEGEPVLGVALLPARDELYWGFLGGGAYKNGRPLRVSAVDRVEESAIGHGALAQFAEAGMVPSLERLARGTYTQRGTADFYGHTLVLDGRLDAMVDPALKPWDLCAVVPLVEEAGGRYSDFAGARTIYGGGCLASNGQVHDGMLTLIRG